MITFFFQPRGAGLIDGQQIGEYLGAKLNPQEGYEDDVCIYVKTQPPEDFPKNSYVNVVDGVGLVGWLQDHPKCGVVSTSLTGQRLLRNTLQREVVFIPEHHCNYANLTKKGSGINTIGAIGNMKGFAIPLEVVEARLGEMGIAFKYCDTYSTRQDIIDFYLGIDLQICWRPHVRGIHAQLHNPLKLANAGSFFIPTVTYPEDNFRAEWDGCFYPVYTIDSLFEAVKDMQKTPLLYDYLSERAFEKAKEYHIEKVAKYYESL